MNIKLPAVVAAAVGMSATRERWCKRSVVSTTLSPSAPVTPSRQTAKPAGVEDQLSPYGPRTLGRPQGSQSAASACTSASLRDTRV